MPYSTSYICILPNLVVHKVLPANILGWASRCFQRLSRPTQLPAMLLVNKPVHRVHPGPFCTNRETNSEVRISQLQDAMSRHRVKPFLRRGTPLGRSACYPQSVFLSVERRPYQSLEIVAAGLGPQSLLAYALALKSDGCSISPSRPKCAPVTFRGDRPSNYPL